MGTILLEEDILVKLAGVIRKKNGTSRNYHPNQMAQAILDLPTDGSTGADEFTVDVLNNTITEFTDPNRKIKTVGNYAMYHASNLTSVDLPVCTSIQAYAFTGDNKITTISIPNCNSVGAHAFEDCTRLVNLGSLKIGTIDQYAFAGSKFTEFHTSSGGRVDNYAFKNNTNLREVTFGRAATFYRYCFNGCSNLETVTLSGDTKSIMDGRQTLTADVVFAGTKILTTGHIYVPANLISVYLEDPLWEPVASRITAIPQPEPSPDPEEGGA